LLRSAQADYCYKKTGNMPILLLDDVLLELDPERRARFIDILPPYKQAFFTFLPGEPYQAYKDDNTLVYWIQDGRFACQSG
jgi:DNA replication and repair protein RecF